MKTIKERSADCLVYIGGMTQGDAARQGIEYHMWGLAKDCQKIADQYWSASEVRRGCELCNVAKCISEEMAAKVMPQAPPQVEECPAKRASGRPDAPEPPEPGPEATIDKRVQAMIEAHDRWRWTSGTTNEELKQMFAAHLEMLVADCCEVIERRRRDVVRQCGGDEGLLASPGSVTFTGYSVATMLAQLSEQILFMGMNKIPWN